MTDSAARHEALRAEPATADQAVLFVSASLVPGEHRPAEAQATPVRGEPFERQALLDCVDELLRVGHQAGQDPQQRS